MVLRLMSGKIALLAGGLLVGAAAAATPSFAQSLTTTFPTSAARTAPGYWTPERMRAAQPVPLPAATAASDAATRLAPPGPTVSRPGGTPEVEPVPAAGAVLNLPEPAPGMSPRSLGTSGIPFSTTLVFPDKQVQTQPYRLAGKLFFSDGGLNYICSAAIIQRRIVLTAAHCVYNTVANRFHTNFLFVPAYNGNLGTQPFGLWATNAATVPNGWANGGLTLPNGFDYAFLETADQVRGSKLQRIGAYLGWFGWATNSLVGNHVTQLGYPANLSGGLRMIQNNSQAFGDGNLAGKIGTAMTGGASGGPWIQDFGVSAPGQIISSTGFNLIVAVTSYGSTASAPQYSGATRFNATYVQVFNSACARIAGNCN